jgi:hypothetical protein
LWQLEHFSADKSNPRPPYDGAVAFMDVALVRAVLYRPHFLKLGSRFDCTRFGSS